MAGTKTGVRRSKNRLSWIQSLRGGEVARRSEGLFQVRLATQTVAHLRRRLNRSANANVCASDDGASRRPLDGLLVRSTASSPPFDDLQDAGWSDLGDCFTFFVAKAMLTTGRTIRVPHAEISAEAPERRPGRQAPW